jgi:hypothetical protein
MQVRGRAQQASRRFLRRSTALLTIAALLSGSALRVRAGTVTRKVAMAPIEAIGTESSAKERTAIEAALFAGFSGTARFGFSFVSPSNVQRDLRKNKADILLCDGDIDCLANMGKALGVEGVVYGELGGLGEARVVYLKLVGVKSRREVRSTTVELGGQSERAAIRAAAVRLLAPAQYRGDLELKVDARDASIYIDGDLVGRSPLPAVPIAVGTHAIRVTHPEFRDFVRFVDVSFEARQTLAVELLKYPVISTEMKRQATELGLVPGADLSAGTPPTPWYYRWYTITGVGILLFAASAFTVGLASEGLKTDRQKTLR